MSTPPPVVATSQAGREFEFADRDFRRICDLIYQRVGISLAPAKRDMVYGRLSRRLRALGMRSFHDYLDQLEAHGGEECTVFPTAFPPTLPPVLAEPTHVEKPPAGGRARGGHAPVRLWACAASPEKRRSSMAITACETFGTLKPPVRILATDVDTQVLATASRGVYAIDRVSGLDPAVRKRYFQRGTGPNEGHCRVLPALRELIDFRPLNLLAPRYDVGGPFDALFCRNVMIYFDKPTQRGILSRLIQHMGDDGLLYTGHSENYLHAADLIQPCGRTLYKRAPGAPV